MSAVAAIVLAAGLGARFGGAKLLAELEGKPLVRHVVEAAFASRAEPVLVVLGHQADAVKGALAGLTVHFVENGHFAEGLSTSLRSGFAALPAEAEAALVLLADMPRVSSSLIDTLVEAWLAKRPEALVPVVEGRRGNPVILSRALTGDIAALSGDHGAGPLLRGRRGVAEIAVDDPAILLDADTPEALQALRSSGSPPTS